MEANEIPSLSKTSFISWHFGPIGGREGALRIVALGEGLRLGIRRDEVERRRGLVEPRLTMGDESFHSSMKLLGNSFERHNQPLHFLPDLILLAAAAAARETFPDSSEV